MRYVFDFDGVLFDTARECLAIAYAAVHGDRATPPPDVATAFLRHRYWVGPPWQYAVLLDCIAGGELPASTAAFLAICARRERELAGFTETYFAARGRLAADRARWLALASPYPSTRAFVDLHARGAAAILSTRDETSIRTLCEHYLGIAPVQLPRAGRQAKWEILVEAAAQRGLEPRRVFFLDDYLHHAMPAHECGFATYLATWGYLGPGDTEHALTGGLPCLQLTDLGPALAAHEERS
ncbi:MAG: HAD family hydrolase [Deltaproteobacteria bacterium]|nr:HAD family hydrolase [Deltaproteobacteria bacterium]